MYIKEFVLLELIGQIFNIIVKLVSHFTFFFQVEYPYFRQSTVPGSICMLHKGEKL